MSYHLKLKLQTILRLLTSSFAKNCIQLAGFSKVKNGSKTDLAAIPNPMKSNLTYNSVESESETERYGRTKQANSWLMKQIQIKLQMA